MEIKSEAIARGIKVRIISHVLAVIDDRSMIEAKQKSMAFSE